MFDVFNGWGLFDYIFTLGWLVALPRISPTYYLLIIVVFPLNLSRNVMQYFYKKLY